MAEQISYPFRMGMHGGVVTSEQGGDQEAFETIQQIIETRPGELLFAEEFGVPDPVYIGLDSGDVQATLSMFGPDDITVNSIATNYVDETRTQLTFEWTRETADEETEESDE